MWWTPHNLMSYSKQNRSLLASQNCISLLDFFFFFVAEEVKRVCTRMDAPSKFPFPHQTNMYILSKSNLIRMTTEMVQVGPIADDQNQREVRGNKNNQTTVQIALFQSVLKACAVHTRQSATPSLSLSLSLSLSNA